MSRFKKVNRNNTSCFKYDYQEVLFNKSNLNPFTISDSDYQAPKEIINALENRVKHGVFGYTFIDDDYKQIMKDFFFRRYGYNIEKDWIVTISGVVLGLSTSVEVLTDVGDYVVIQPPVYPPFYRVVKEQNRNIILNDLINDNDKYSINFIDLEEKLKSGAKMLLFCNPQNPVGRVYTRREVKQVVDLCKKYNVILISDEIHCDLILDGNQFTSVGNFLDIYDNIIICTAPSKTFNIAGIHIANMIIKNDEHRFKIIKYLKTRSLLGTNIFGIVACKEAYSNCDYWLDEQLKHISDNYKLLCKYFEDIANVTKLEGTYLVWVNLKFLGLSGKEIIKGLTEYNVAVYSGHDYGVNYDQYIRINIACPKEQLEKGLKQIIKFINDKKMAN